MKGLYVGNQYVEYDLSPVGQGKKAAIFLLGLPGSPKRYAVFEDFKNDGFDIFLPRYEGTWESKGIFLENSPVQAIDELSSLIHSGLDLGGATYAADSIYVMGASFGGGVALSIQDHDFIKGVCALSPVVSFAEVVGIETLGKYLGAAEADHYRFNSDRWGKLISDNLYCPSKLTYLDSTKILILAGEDDDQILAKSVSRYAIDRNIQHEIFASTGHITFSRLTKSMVDLILNFFKQK
ncbi:MAG TPA: hypothetical protein VGE62_03380 [Candidatus Paceibacterota bacterium]